MSLTLEQLKAFVETVEQGSFKLAATQVGKHASTVSELVANLEIDTGLSLFTRQARSLQLTGQGKELYAYAKAVLNETELLQSKVESLLAEEPVRFRLAIDPALRSEGVTRCYQAVLERYPTLELKVLTADPMQILGWVRAKRVDLGVRLSLFTQSQDIVTTRIYDFELVRIVPANAALASQLTAEQTLRSMIQIAYTPMLEAGQGEAHILSNHLIYSNNVFEMLEMVRAGLGWCTLPRYLAQSHIDAGEVQVAKFEGGRNDVWFTEVLRLSETVPNPAMQLFMEQLMKLPERKAL